jgi:transglutaminase-like putative cysteine protease
MSDGGQRTDVEQIAPGNSVGGEGSAEAGGEQAQRYRISHSTVYAYGGNVAHSHQQLHLTPRPSARQRCLAHTITVNPTPTTRSEHADAFGNTVTRLEIERPHDRLEVLAEMEVTVDAPTEDEEEDGERWEAVRERLTYLAKARTAEWLDAMRFRSESPYVRIKRVFGDFARDCFEPDRGVVAVAAALMTKIHSEFTYSPGATQIATPLLEVLERRQGVCQDYAHLMIACLRSRGLAARYVSGYLRTGTLVGADASHAWVAVFAPPLGWIEFDPTNNLRVRQEHIALAWGRDFADVSPLRGVLLGGGSHSLEVSVAVAPLD